MIFYHLLIGLALILWGLTIGYAVFVAPFNGFIELGKKWFLQTCLLRDVLGFLVFLMRGDLGGMLMCGSLATGNAIAVYYASKRDDDDDDDLFPKLTKLGEKIVEKTQRALSPVAGPLPQPT